MKTLNPKLNPKLGFGVHRSLALAEQAVSDALTSARSSSQPLTLGNSVRYGRVQGLGLGFGVWGLLFAVCCLLFGVWGLGFGVWGLGLGFGVWGLGFGVWGLLFGVWGLGFRDRV